jgi:hypothetical protein
MDRFSLKYRPTSLEYRQRISPVFSPWFQEFMKKILSKMGFNDSKYVIFYFDI